MVPKGNVEIVTRRPGRLALLSLVAGAGFLLTSCGGDTLDASAADKVRPSGPSVEARLRELPADARAALTSGHEMLREGRFEEAAATFEGSALAAQEPLVRAEANLGAAMAAFEAGDRDASLTHLRAAAHEAPSDSALKRRATYLLGLRLNDRGDHAEAAKVLRPQAEGGSEDALQPFVLAEYASALEENGDREGAARTWNALFGTPGLPGSLRTQAARELADLAAAAGDSQGEARWLVEAVNVSGESGLRFRLAQVSARNGDQGTFVAQLQAIVRNSPASQRAVEAVDALKAAGVPVAAGDEGLVRYRHGELEATQAVLEPATAALDGKPAGESAFELFYLAAAYEDLGKLEEAVATYDRAALADPTSNYAHRAKYWAARVSEEMENHIGAALRYADIAINGPAGEFSSESAFRAGYSLLSGGNPAGAVATWEQMGATATPRVLYWKGRAFEALGNPEAANASFEAAIAADPLDFYAEEAARRVNRAAPADVSYKALGALPSTNWQELESWLTGVAGPRPAAGPASTAAAELAALGLTDPAERIVRDAARAGGPWEMVDALRQADELGMPNVAAELAVKLRQDLKLTWQQASPELMKLAYPVGYPGLLDRVAKENGIDPLFLAALVRQESFWDADAGSHAGALGLTQVIPPTGAAIAESLGQHDFKAEDLFRPAVSLPFGGHYIGGQLKQFGNPYEALAAYNAGPGPVYGWAEAAGGGSAADFVEAVQYPETKGYVVYVMEHYAHYRQAWRK